MYAYMESVKTIDNLLFYFDFLAYYAFLLFQHVFLKKKKMSTKFGNKNYLKKLKYKYEKEIKSLHLINIHIF